MTKLSINPNPIIGIAARKATILSCWNVGSGVVLKCRVFGWIDIEDWVLGVLAVCIVFLVVWKSLVCFCLHFGSSERVIPLFEAMIAFSTFRWVFNLVVVGIILIFCAKGE